MALIEYICKCFWFPYLDQLLIKLQYAQKVGGSINFKEPQTFNEKVNWRKLYQRDPRFPIYADKIKVKEKVKSLIGEKHIIPTLWTGKKAEDIPFHKLKPPYIIKPNNGYGKQILIHSRKDIDEELIKEKINSFLTYDYASQNKEWGYKTIEPEIIIESVLETKTKESPDDFKFFVYHGKVHFVSIDEGRFTRQRRSYFTPDMSRMPPIADTPSPLAKNYKMPTNENWQSMLHLAETIGKEFDFVRVDLYFVPSGIFFGEITFTPAAGYKQFNSLEWDMTFGKPWEIPKDI